jgi:hypothetical protein
LESMSSRSRSRLRVAVVVVAAAAVSVFVASASGVIGGGAPVATFAIQLDSEPLTTAKGYDLDAAIVGVDKRGPIREYTLRISLALRDNPAPAQAFQNGQTFASAKIDLLSAGAEALATYELAGATVVAYRQTGDAATNTFDQQLVLKSRTLTISSP